MKNSLYCLWLERHRRRRRLVMVWKWDPVNNIQPLLSVAVNRSPANESSGWFDRRLKTCSDRYDSSCLFFSIDLKMVSNVIMSSCGVTFVVKLMWPITVVDENILIIKYIVHLFYHTTYLSANSYNRLK